jgi:pyruvate-ferredoxin/flavodoxin oxidoreductase
MAPGMSGVRMIAVDGSDAAASVAYRCDEMVAIQPITASSPIGELGDTWVAYTRPNRGVGAPDVVEIRFEAGGAAGW